MRQQEQYQSSFLNFLEGIFFVGFVLYISGILIHLAWNLACFIWKFIWKVTTFFTDIIVYPFKKLFQFTKYMIVLVYFYSIATVTFLVQMIIPTIELLFTVIGSIFQFVYKRLRFQ